MADDPATGDIEPVKVRLRHAEVMAAAMQSRSRIKSGGFVFSAILFALLVVAIWAGHLAAFMLVQYLPFWAMFAIGTYVPVLLPALFALAAVTVALSFEQKRLGAAYLRRLKALRIPLERDGTYRVTNDALVLETERVTIAPRWQAIDTVEKGATGWVVSADQLHMLIPFDAFADEDAQRSLLAAITSRMDADARARSREAVEFAGGAPLGMTPPPVAAQSAAPDPAQAGPESPAAHGWLTLEQANWAAGVIYARIARPGLHGWLYPLTAGLAGVAAGTALMLWVGMVISPEIAMRHAMALTWIGYLVPITLGALGLVIGGRRSAAVIAKVWRAGLADRGVPDQVEATWRLTPTGVAYETARFSGEAPYAAIQEVLRESDYWLIACDTLTLCIPDPAFAAPGDARAFIAALLQRIDEPARERSAGAVAVASAS